MKPLHLLPAGEAHPHRISSPLSEPGVVFIKTHATGSSTLTSIMHRFCDANGSTCFVYPRGVHAGSTLSAAQLRDWVAPDSIRIFANHAVYEPVSFAALFPTHKVVSLFRHPVARLASSLRHARTAKLEWWLSAALSGRPRALPWARACGPQGPLMSEHVPLQHLWRLDLVMLTEEYDRSLVLLRRLLGWSLADLLYLRLKESSGHQQALASRFERWLYGAVANTSEGSAANLMWQRCVLSDETRLYFWAQQRFREQLRVAAPGIEQEERRFAELQAELAAACSGTKAAARPHCARFFEDNLQWNARHGGGTTRAASGASTTETDRRSDHT